MTNNEIIGGIVLVLLVVWVAIEIKNAPEIKDMD